MAPLLVVPPVPGLVSGHVLRRLLLKIKSAEALVFLLRGGGRDAPHRTSVRASLLLRVSVSHERITSCIQFQLLG